MFSKSKVAMSEDTYYYYREFIWFFRMVGLFPFSIEKSQSQLFLKLSPFWTFYSCIWGCLFTFISFYGIICDIMEGVKGILLLRIDTDKIMAFINWTSFNAVLFCGVFVVPSTFLRFFSYKKCINQVDSIIKTTYRSSDKRKSMLLLAVPTILMASITVSSAHLVYLTRNGEITVLHLIKLYTGLFVASTETIVVENTGAIVMKSLEIRIRRLNELLRQEYLKLRNLKRAIISHSKICFEHVSAATSDNSVNVPNVNTVNANRLKNESSADQGDRIEGDSVENLTKAYLKIMDAVNHLSYCFGPSTVIFILSAFWALILVFYFLGLNMANKRDTVADLPPRFVWLTVCFLRMIILTEPTYANLVRIETTKRWVCHILSCDVDRNYRKQVKRFALILEFRRFQYSPCGIFVVDRRLFLSLIEGITTFLVILLQRQATERT